MTCSTNVAGPHTISATAGAQDGAVTQQRNTSINFVNAWPAPNAIPWGIALNMCVDYNTSNPNIVSVGTCNDSHLTYQANVNPHEHSLFLGKYANNLWFATAAAARSGAAITINTSDTGCSGPAWFGCFTAQ